MLVVVITECFVLSTYSFWQMGGDQYSFLSFMYWRIPYLRVVSDSDLVFRYASNLVASIKGRLLLVKLGRRGLPRFFFERNRKWWEMTVIWARALWKCDLFGWTANDNRYLPIGSNEFKLYILCNWRYSPLYKIFSNGGFIERLITRTTFNILYFRILQYISTRGRIL